MKQNVMHACIILRVKVNYYFLYIILYIKFSQVFVKLIKANFILSNHVFFGCSAKRIQKLIKEKSSCNVNILFDFSFKHLIYQKAVLHFH